MKCIHLGEKVGSLVSNCCNDGETFVDLYQCRSTKQSADWCILHGPTKSLAPIALDGQERRTESVAGCTGCPFREQPASLPAIEIVSKPPRSKSSIMWDELKNRRNPSPHIDKIAVLDVDRKGFGDVIMAAWISEGSKDTTPRLSLRATGDKKTLLEMLGQEVLGIDASVTFGSEYAWQTVGIGSPPAILAHALKFGIKDHPQRPTVTIPDRAIEWALDHASDILLFPHSFQVSRTWPYEYWEELYKLLIASGLRVLVVGLPDERWSWCQNWVTNVSWAQIAAMIRSTRLVIGNDSGPIHLAGTMDRNAIAIMGRTTEVVFAMYPSVRCLQTEKREVPCAGCYGGWNYKREVCEYGCVAISHITPERVMENVWL